MQIFLACVCNKVFAVHITPVLSQSRPDERILEIERRSAPRCLNVGHVQSNVTMLNVADDETAGYASPAKNRRFRVETLETVGGRCSRRFAHFLQRTLGHCGSVRSSQ